ncbi:MAG: hypothetical protein Q8O67_08360 [Deltaproteobacteria bacterium]|nr:hypothetical protein [Deltaproteobacteria bacterium]
MPHKLVVLAFGASRAGQHHDGSLDSADPRLRAGQAQLSLMRLADQGRLTVQDAVLVTNTAGAPPFVEDIVDDHGVEPPARVGTGFWAAFFNALQGVGDDDLHELKRAVGPDTTSLAVLASDLDPLVELRGLAGSGERHPGDRVVVMDFGRCVDLVRNALHAPTSFASSFAFG